MRKPRGGGSDDESRMSPARAGPRQAYRERDDTLRGCRGAEASSGPEALHLFPAPAAASVSTGSIERRSLTRPPIGNGKRTGPIGRSDALLIDNFYFIAPDSFITTMPPVQLIAWNPAIVFHGSRACPHDRRFLLPFRHIFRMYVLS